MSHFMAIFSTARLAFCNENAFKEYSTLCISHIIQCV